MCENHGSFFLDWIDLFSGVVVVVSDDYMNGALEGAGGAGRCQMDTGANEKSAIYLGEDG